MTQRKALEDTTLSIAAFTYKAWYYTSRWLPIALCCGAGGAVAIALRRGAPAQHRDAKRLISALRPDLMTDRAAEERAARRLWSSIGRVYAELPAMARLLRAGHVQIDGADALDAAVGTGRPAIILFAHTGSWELSGMHLAMRHPHRILAIYSPLGSPEETAFAMRTRRTMPASFAPMSPMVWRRAILHLRGSEALLWIAADEWDGGQVRTPAFGRARRYDGNLGKAVRLARRTGAIIVPMCSERVSSREVRTIILPVVDVGRGEACDDDLRDVVDGLDDLFAGQIARLADQWYMAPHVGPLPATAAAAWIGATAPPSATSR